MRDIKQDVQFALLQKFTQIISDLGKHFLLILITMKTYSAQCKICGSFFPGGHFIKRFVSVFH